MAGFPQPVRHFAVAFEGRRGGKARERQLVPIDKPLDSPDTSAGAIFVDRLRSQVAVGGLHHIGDFREPVVLLVTGWVGVF
jgi:hypothetical protein